MPATSAIDSGKRATMRSHRSDRFMGAFHLHVRVLCSAMHAKLSSSFAELAQRERGEADWKAVEDTVRGAQCTCGVAARRRTTDWLRGQQSGANRGVDSRCIGVRRAVPGHRPDARSAAAESGSVAGSVSAARSGPQCCPRSNPAARRIVGIPSREGGDVGGRSAQAFGRVANFNVSPRLLPTPFITMARDSLGRRSRRPAAPRLCGFHFRSHLRG